MDPNLPAEPRRIFDSLPERPKKKSKRRSFRFLDLPSELRLRIYEYCLVLPQTIDLDPSNIYCIAPRLDLLLSNRQIYSEAWPVFYGANTFRLFPTHGQYFHTTKILLRRLPAKYRAGISTLELLLGPGWTQPPKCWNAGPQTCLRDCNSLRTLKVFVQLDPSHDIFKGFRHSDSFYTDFCGDLLQKIYAQVPSLEVVHIDALASITLRAPLLQRVLDKTTAAGKRISWSPDRRWDEESEPLAEAKPIEPAPAVGEVAV